MRLIYLILVILIVFIAVNAYIFLTDKCLINTGYSDNPTMSELSGFIDSYQYDKGNCKDIATRLHNVTELSGIKSHILHVELLNGSHVINAFNTLDNGTVYIDLNRDKNIINWQTFKLGYEYIGEIQEYGR